MRTICHVDHMQNRGFSENAKSRRRVAIHEFGGGGHDTQSDPKSIPTKKREKIKTARGKKDKKSDGRSLTRG